MTERRRFFPAMPVQQVPGRTVELEMRLTPQPEPVPVKPEKPQEPVVCEITYALGWPERAGPSELQQLDSALDILAYSVNGAGSYTYAWMEPIYVPFQIVNVAGNGRMPMAEGYTVDWIAEEGWSSDVLPTVVFDPSTGRGYVDTGASNNQPFGMRIRLLRDGTEVGHLVMIRADGSYIGAYGSAVWTAWA